MSGIHVKFEITPTEFLDELTGAAYEVALQHGIGNSFLEMELDLYAKMKEVIARTMEVSSACGATKACREAPRAKPWSELSEGLLIK